MSRLPVPSSVFKPWIVKRPDGGCQVLFPLSELDRLLDEAVELAIERRARNAKYRYILAGEGKP